MLTTSLRDASPSSNPHSGLRLSNACSLPLTVLLLQLALASVTATAQVPESALSGREALWLNSGVGTVPNWEGRGARLAIGGKLGQSLLLGAELMHYEKRGEDGLREFHDYLTATALLQPRSWPWGTYVKAGVGLAMYGYQAYIPGFMLTLGSEGPGYTLGAGADIPLIWRIALTPTVDFYHSFDVKGDPPPILLFSIGLTML